MVHCFITNYNMLICNCTVYYKGSVIAKMIIQVVFFQIVEYTIFVFMSFVG